MNVVKLANALSCSELNIESVKDKINEVEEVMASRYDKDDMLIYEVKALIKKTNELIYDIEEINSIFK